MKMMMAGIVAIGVMSSAGPSQAGCLTGAAVGGAAGHFAGHHAVLGAIAGCAIGHHQAKKKRLDEQRTSTPDQTKTAM